MPKKIVVSILATLALFVSLAVSAYAFSETETFNTTKDYHQIV